MNKRYASMDSLKAIISFFVVCLHIKFPESIGGGYINALARIAVPCFFMISGFFSCNAQYNQENDYRRRLKRLRKLVYLLVIFNLLYVFINIIKNLNGDNILCFLTDQYSSKMFLIANFGFGGHLWYIRALLYIEVGLLFAEKILRKFCLTPILIILWISDILLCKYSNIIFHMEIAMPFREMLSKYIGVAILYYFIGWECKKNEDKIREYKVKNTAVLICAFALINLIEYYLLNKCNADLMPANYITTFPLSVLIFIVVLQSEQIGTNTFIEKIGYKYSENIYFYHPMIIYILEFVTLILKNHFVFNSVVLLNPIVVYILSVFWGMWLIKCSNVVRCCYRKKF